MSECKKYHNMINEFDNDILPLKDAEDFIYHVTNCGDCFEEYEMYYIVKYGINDNYDNNIPLKYQNFIEVFDFKGLVNEKIKNKIEQIEQEKKQNIILKMCVIFSNLFIFVLIIEFVIIKFFL